MKYWNILLSRNEEYFTLKDACIERTINYSYIVLIIMFNKAFFAVMEYSYKTVPASLV